MCRAVDEYGNEREALGLEKGLIESLRNIMNNLNMNVYEAMKVLNISEKEYDKYIQLL